MNTLRATDFSTIETINALFKFVPIEASIGLLVISIFLLYLFIKEPIAIASTFIIVTFIGAYLRNVLATQPFFEMYQIYRGGSGLFVKDLPTQLNFLHLMNDQDWINAAFYYGLFLNLAISYITYYVIKNLILYLVKRDLRFGLSLIGLIVLSFSGKNIREIIVKALNTFKGSKHG